MRDEQEQQDRHLYIPEPTQVTEIKAWENESSCTVQQLTSEMVLVCPGSGIQIIKPDQSLDNVSKIKCPSQGCVQLMAFSDESDDLLLVEGSFFSDDYNFYVRQ
jgi:hypothetical protein